MTYDKDKYNALFRIVYVVYSFIGAAIFMAIVLIDGGKSPQLLLKGAIFCFTAVIVASVITRIVIIKKIDNGIEKNEEQ